MSIICISHHKPVCFLCVQQGTKKQDGKSFSVLNFTTKHHLTIRVSVVCS